MIFILTDYFLAALSAVLCPGYHSSGRMEEIKKKKYERGKIFGKHRRK
jgi:hypothetical protein